MQKLLRLFGHSIAVFALCLSLAQLLSPSVSYAANNQNCTNLGVGIGKTQQVCGNGNTQLENYISAIVTWADVALPIFSVGMIVYGGFKYMLSRGNPDQIKDAKSTIIGALSGLFLLMIANVLLITINPNLAGPVGRIFR